MQNNNEAARLLAEHGEVTAAVTRLMRPVAQAAKQGQQPSSNWADKDALLQLYTYCTNLNSEWALQQVRLSLPAQIFLVVFFAATASHCCAKHASALNRYNTRTC